MSDEGTLSTTVYQALLLWVALRLNATLDARVANRIAFLAMFAALLPCCGGSATSSIGRGGGGDTGATGQSGSASGGAASGGAGASGGTTSGGTTSGGSGAASGSGGGVTLPPVDPGSIQERRAACREAFGAQWSLPVWHVQGSRTLGR
jgi:hypothetical protein